MTFPSLRIEGSILTADLLDAIAREDKHSQKPADFGLPASARVKDEIASTWASAKTLWATYQAKVAGLKEGQTGASETRNLFLLPLLSLLGYQPEKTDAETRNGKTYAISHRDPSRDGFPIHIMGWRDSLDAKRTAGGPRMSPHALVQEYLNLTEHLYALVTNGRQLRLLRDSSRLIRLSFLEFDFVRMFEEDLFADFAILYRLLHATRMPANRAQAAACILEKYHQDSVDSGSRIRDGLAAAVAFAMQTVANGLLSHPDNRALVDALRADAGRAGELHQNLLRWIYRTLFLFVIEERGLNHAPDATLRQRRVYRDCYSLQRLRRLADRPQLADRRARDLWRAMHQTLRLYEDGGKGLPLGVAPLGSFLFREDGLNALFQYQLDNRSLLEALNRLSNFIHPDTKVRMRVNYGALDVEEFGSVYESLLELRPRVVPDGEGLNFAYAQLAGNERKTTGSYYTPDSLVQCLLDSALDPVIEERLAEAKAKTPSPPSKGGEGRGEVGSDSLREALEQALLSIKVCDPAVGSGHFLIGAAHRLAQKLAEIRAGDEALSPDAQRRALRDVVSHCLYGVDINPLSVELCKVSLWMLGMEPGKPLGFLDHHIKCGNSLLGATPEAVAGGIPDDAFKPIAGDDKEACARLKKRNKAEREGMRHLFVEEDNAWRESMRRAAVAIDDQGDDTPEDIRRKEAAFRNAQQNYDFQKARDLAHLWCSALVIQKQFPDTATPVAAADAAGASDDAAPEAMPELFGGFETGPEPKNKPGKAKKEKRPDSIIPFGITTQHLRNFVKGETLPERILAESHQLARQYQFFHWHLEFPDVFAGALANGQSRMANGGEAGPSDHSPLTTHHSPFESAGFDVILGNPPWERVKLQEKEWFAERCPEIANAPNAAARKRLIAATAREQPALFAAFETAQREAEGASHLLRDSGLYPLCGRGDVNVYTVFAELFRNRLNAGGRCGAVLPSGIATDDTTKFFFQDVVETNSLRSLFDFENRKGLFPAVDSRMKFCLFTSGSPRWGGASGESRIANRGKTATPDPHSPLATHHSPGGEAAVFAFFCLGVEDLHDPDKRFSLSPDDIALLNPNTRTCPIFRTRQDAELTKAIYRRIPVLMLEQMQRGKHELRLTRLFDMGQTKVAAKAKTIQELSEADLKKFVPMYEGKMFAMFNHRAANVTFNPENTTRPAQSEDVTAEQLADASFSPKSLFWYPVEEVDSSLKDYADSKWFVGYKNVCSPTNERSMIAAITPRCAANFSVRFALFHHPERRKGIPFLAAVSSFCFDYALRQSLGGINLADFIFKQSPVVGVPDEQESFVASRVLELTYTAWDLEAFARDCLDDANGESRMANGDEGFAGYWKRYSPHSPLATHHSPPPFRWAEDRRFLLRCELDAAFFHLYLPADGNGEWRMARKADGCPYDETPEQLAELKRHFPTPRDAAAYILDTFPIVRRKDEQKHGHYRTKDTILKIHDAMQQAMATGHPYQTLLNPPPADPSCCHPPKKEAP